MFEVDVISPFQVGHIPREEWGGLQQACSELVLSAVGQKTMYDDPPPEVLDVAATSSDRVTEIGKIADIFRDYIKPDGDGGGAGGGGGGAYAPGAAGQRVGECTVCTIRRQTEGNPTTYDGVAFVKQGTIWYNLSKGSTRNFIGKHLDGVGFGPGGLESKGKSGVPYSVAIPVTGDAGDDTPQTLLFPADEVMYNATNRQVVRKDGVKPYNPETDTATHGRPGDIINDAAVVHCAPEGTNRIFIRMQFTGEKLLQAKVRSFMVSNLRF